MLYNATATGGRLSLACRCGNVSGVLEDVSASNGLHIVCYCDDCQAFARFLSFFLRITGVLLRGFIAGAHRPSPFFDERGAPVSVPEILSPDQRARLAVTA